MADHLANMQSFTHPVLGTLAFSQAALETTRTSPSKAASERKRVCLVGIKSTNLLVQKGRRRSRDGKGPARELSVSPS